METLKMLLGIKDNEQDGLLSFLLADTENLIKSYCRIEFIPTKLESVIPVIAADMYRLKGYGAQNAPTQLTSETEGSRSRSYANISVDTTTVLLGYEKRLEPFINRKGRVPSELL